MLLPSDDHAACDRELEVQLESMSGPVKVVDGIAYPEGVVPPAPSPEARARAEEYIARARALVDGPLGPVSPLVRCAGVTGSAAFGNARPGDDLDLFVVTREGAVWAFLAIAFLRLRLRGRPPSSDDPVWCLNFVTEDSAVARDFQRPHDFQFAREALSVRLIRGDRFYRSVLGGAPWIGSEAPGLYDQWRGTGWPPAPDPARASVGLRIFNLASFVVLAPYQQAKALVVNARTRRSGRADEGFRVVTVPSRFAVQSDRYRRLAAVYAGA